MHDIQCAEEELLNQLLSSIRLVMSVSGCCGSSRKAELVRKRGKAKQAKQSKNSKVSSGYVQRCQLCRRSLVRDPFLVLSVKTVNTINVPHIPATASIHTTGRSQYHFLHSIGRIQHHCQPVFTEPSHMLRQPTTLHKHTQNLSHRHFFQHSLGGHVPARQLEACLWVSEAPLVVEN